MSHRSPRAVCTLNRLASYSACINSTDRTFCATSASLLAPKLGFSRANSLTFSSPSRALTCGNIFNVDLVCCFFLARKMFLFDSKNVSFMARKMILFWLEKCFFFSSKNVSFLARKMFLFWLENFLIGNCIVFF